MVTFRNNNNYRKGRFRSNDRNFKRNNGENHKFKSEFSSNVNFQRKIPGKNNHNASKLVEKYSDLAREALAHEDKILSENYFQHADHFMRIIEDKNKNRNQSKPNVIDKPTDGEKNLSDEGSNNQKHETENKN